jgi:hypothetical protein
MSATSIRVEMGRALADAGLVDDAPDGSGVPAVDLGAQQRSREK